MYNLALRYRGGLKGVQRDAVQANELMMRSAESGSCPGWSSLAST
jgi:TPR repeat protein